MEPPAPAPEPERYPDDSAARSSPFVDATLGAVTSLRRFTSSPLTPGLRAGVLVEGRFLFSGRAVLLPRIMDTFYNEAPTGYSFSKLPQPRVVLGVSAGVVPFHASNFLLVPALSVLRTDLAENGTIVGVEAPATWVTDRGLRLGVDFMIGAALGGERRARCTGSDVVGPIPPCDLGEERIFGLRPGMALVLGFMMGWGFNHPAPLGTPPTRAPAPRQSSSRARGSR